MMKIVIACALAAAILAPLNALSRETAQVMTDAQFARSFRCPESLSNDEARSAETKRFVDWVAARHPDWDVQRLITHRVKLLETNGCDETLRSIRASAGK